MIPIFPTFKKLEISDKVDIENITSKFPPYSDYNFVSLWSYNVEDDIIISNLHGNLVVRFRDYLTNEPFFSFLGSNEIQKTSHTLFDHAQKNHGSTQINLIPESALTEIDTHKAYMSVLEDRDNHDYIYSIEELSSLAGAKFSKKRNHIHRFKKSYGNPQFVPIDITKPHIQKRMLQLFSEWEKNNKKQRSETDHELRAINRLMSQARLLNIEAFALTYEEVFIGFSILERIGEYGLFHFTKGNVQFDGVYEVLYHEIAKTFYARGCVYLNREQDLGIPGLKSAKSQWNPTHFLKKYTISPKS